MTEKKKSTYTTLQQGSGDYKCDLGPEEKKDWNEWKMLSSSSLWLEPGPFFSFLKTHIRPKPGISTFTFPSILHHISDCPSISLCSSIFIKLCKRVSTGSANVLGSGKGWDDAEAAAAVGKHTGLPTPAVGNVLHLLILFVIVNLSLYK